MDSTILIFLLLIIIVIITLIILNFGKKSGGTQNEYNSIKNLKDIDDKIIKLLKDYLKTITNKYVIDYDELLIKLKQYPAFNGINTFDEIIDILDNEKNKFYEIIKNKPDPWFGSNIPWSRKEKLDAMKINLSVINNLSNNINLINITDISNIFICISIYNGIMTYNGNTFERQTFINNLKKIIFDIKWFISEMKNKYNTLKNICISSYFNPIPDFSDDNLYNINTIFIFRDFTLELDEKTADCELSELIRHDNLVKIDKFIVLSRATKTNIQNATRNSIVNLIIKLKNIRLTTTLSAAEEKALNDPIPNSTADRLALYNLLKSFYPRLQDVFQNDNIKIPSLESIEKFNQRYSIESEIPGKIGIYYQKDEILPESKSYPNGTIILYPEHETDLEVGPLIIKSFIENDLKSQCPPDIITKVIQNKIMLTPKYIMRNVKDNKLIEFTKTNI